MRIGSGEGFTIKNFILFFESPNIVRVIKSRRLRRGKHVARIEEGRSAFKILTEKRPLGRPRHRWEDNVRMGLNLSSTYVVVCHQTGVLPQCLCLQITFSSFSSRLSFVTYESICLRE